MALRLAQLDETNRPTFEALPRMPVQHRYVTAGGRR
jgi:hypothetical protein